MRWYLILLAATLSSSSSYAQWSTDPSLNTRVTNGGLLPQIISDGNGGAYIVYQDSPVLLRQLWVQRLDRYGHVRFPNNGMRVSSEDRNQTPYYFLVSDSVGGVIVVFQDFRLVGELTLGAVYAQRIDSSGTKLWGEAGVEISPPAHGKAPVSACSDGENGVFVFWGEDADSNGISELWGQRVNAGGKTVWSDRGIVITDEFTSFNVATPNPAVSDGSRGVIVSYSDSKKFGRKVQRLNSQGIFMWEPATETIYINGLMSQDRTGGVIFAGRHVDSLNIISYKGQRFNAQGEPMWGISGVTVKDSVESTLIPIPGIAVNENSQTTMVWQSKNDNTEDVYINKINETGTLVFLNNMQVSGFRSRKLAPKVICSDNFSDIIFWYDYRDDTNLNIYAQKLNHLAQRQWDEDDIAISTRIGNQTSFQIISDLRGGVIVCWYEVGTGNGWGIFAQQVSKNGRLGEVLSTSVSEPERVTVPKLYFLHQNYPNPFNSSMVIKYELPTSTFVQLRVLDLSGKEVIELINKEQRPGIHKVVWNGKNTKGGDVVSGIYFYQLRAGNFVETKKALFMK